MDETVNVALRIGLSFVVLFIGFSVMFAAFSWIEEIEKEAKDKACEVYGLQREKINGFDTCVTPGGVAQIIKLHCTHSILDPICTAQFIKLQTFGVEVV